MPKPQLSEDDVIREWKKLDAASDAPVGVNDLAVALGISRNRIYQLSAGRSLTDIKREHGIRLSPQEQHRTDDELLARFDSIVTKRGRLPTWNVLMRQSGISEKTWKKTLGGRAGCSQKDVYRRYQQWLGDHHPTSPNLALVTRALAEPPASAPAADTPRRPRGGRAPTYPKADRPSYGDLMFFGNLTHTPTNEQGVVFLFGMVSRALGFESVESFRPVFPDCEAKWRIRSGELQRVRIEFEHTSREFVSHGHNPADCDVIVCWEHNWKECPASIHVIELRKEIESLRDRPEFKH